MTHFVLISALWGYIASWINEFIKQDRWSKSFNTVIADVVVVITAAIVTFTQTNVWTWHAFFTALIAAFTIAVTHANGFLNPSGVGPALQTATSLGPKRVTSPPSNPA